MQIRTIHRVLSISVVLFTLYLGVTGSLIEMIDFRTILTSPSPLDPNLMAMREDFAGPPNFRVLGAADHLAQPLPANADLTSFVARVASAAEKETSGAPLKFVELRMTNGQPLGQVEVGKQTLRFDPVTGASLGKAPPALNEDMPPESLRNTIKHLHRMTTFGNWALWINIIVSAALLTLIVTGMIVYWRIWFARQRMKRRNPFWTAGGWWRALHRSISLVAVLFITVISLSGAWLAVESLLFGMYLSHNPAVLALDPSSPLAVSTLPEMLSVTLGSYHAADPGDPVRVVRLRNYGTMSQGVVISGDNPARQLVYDTSTGQSVRLTEPGYPATGFPFGWQMHQWAKSVHRGDFFGLTGRVTSLLAGLAIVYLSISGIVMYWTMWSKRRKAGRKAFFWK